MTTKRHPITVDGETYRVHVAANGMLYAIRPGPWGHRWFGRCAVAFADTREDLASEIRQARFRPRCPSGHHERLRRRMRGH